MFIVDFQALTLFEKLDFDMTILCVVGLVLDFCSTCTLAHGLDFCSYVRWNMSNDSTTF